MKLDVFKRSLFLSLIKFSIIYYNTPLYTSKLGYNNFYCKLIRYKNIMDNINQVEPLQNKYIFLDFDGA